MTGGQVAPGWYPDPRRRGSLRWWDGHQWTEHTRAAEAQPAPQPLPWDGKRERTRREKWTSRAVLSFLGLLLIAGIIGAAANAGHRDKQSATVREAAFQIYVSTHTSLDVTEAERTARSMCASLDAGASLAEFIAATNTEDELTIIGAGIGAFCPSHKGDVSRLQALFRD